MRFALVLSAFMVTVIIFLGYLSSTAHTNVSNRCMEDMPCFNWTTMGNRDRGVILTNGHRVIVSPCRFHQLFVHHRLSVVNDALLGDRTAHC